ncbi:MAG: ankyrin repeat domain-containing protein [Betaproteobacteria bacterium]
MLSPPTPAAETGEVPKAPLHGPGIDVLQNGVAVQPVAGVFDLARAPFVVRVAPGSGRMSVVATSSADALGDARALWGAPLVATLETDHASPPLALNVLDGGLEFYEGLAPGFLDQWGPVLGVARMADLALLRASFPRSPHVLVTQRQQTTAVLRKDGSQLLPVFRLGAEAIRSSDVESLTLFLFFERAPDVQPSWAVIDDIETLRLRFHPGAPVPTATLEPASSVLDCGGSGVVQAVRQNDFQRIERLMQQGIDPNTRSARGNVTLLMCAVGGPEVYGNAIWALLEAGADVNARTAHGDSALMWAARSGDRGVFSRTRLNAVQQLLSRGADVNAADADGETALLGAVAMGYAEIVAALLSAGADPGMRNKAGETALARAQRLGLTDIAGLVTLYP